MAALFGLGLVFDAYDQAEHAIETNPFLDEGLGLGILLLGALSVVVVRRARQVVAERHLREAAEASYRALVEEAPAVSYTWDPVHRAHTYVSPQIEPLLGYTQAEWCVDFDTWSRYVHPDDRERLLAASVAADGTATDFQEEYRVTASDGRVVWLRDESRYVAFDERGRPTLAQGVMYDITRQKEAERRAAESEARFQTIVERVPAVAYVWDGTDDPVGAAAAYISPQIEVLLGYRAEDWLANPLAWNEAIHPEDHDRVLDAWVAAVEDGGSFAEEYRIQRADGIWVWLRDEANPVGSGRGNAPTYQGVMFDVTERRRAEDHLRDAEERWRTLLEHLPVTAYRIDYELAGDQTIHDRWVAPGITALLGITPEEWLTHENAWSAHLHPEDRDRVMAAWEVTVRTGGTLDLEYRMLHADGHTVWVYEETAVATRDGRVLADGVFIDVTDRRLAEQALGEAEVRFKNLVEQLPAMTYVEDPATGETVYVSPRIVDLLGYTPEEWMSDVGLWERSLHPEDRAWVIAENDADTGDSWSVDYRSITRDGRVVWLHNETVLVRDGAGTPLFWQGVVTDITERKQSEERLRDAEERYRALVEQLPVVVYSDAVDDVSTALYISPRYEQLTGYSPEQRMLDPGLWTRMLHPEDREQVLTESRRTNETGDPFDIEYRLVSADGRTIWVHDHAMLVTGTDGRQIWQGVLQDVTERHVAEEALARRDAILQATGFAAERFLGSTSWQDALDDVLARLGRAGEATRTFLYRNEEDDEGRAAVSLVRAWQSPTSPTIDRPDLTSRFPWHEGGFTRWVDVLGSGQVLHGDIEDFPEAEREVFRGTGIRSLVVVPVFVRDRWWGYIGFDDLERARMWHETEIEALTVTANTLGAAITRDLASTELAETQKRYRTLVEQIPAMTYIQRADDAEILYYSPQVHEVLGYGDDEWGAFEFWANAIHPDDRARVVEEDRITNETGAPFHLEYRLLAKDGRTVWIRDDAVLVRDDDGTPMFWQGVRFDVTEQKEAEERLRAAEERYRGIVEHVPAAIYLDRADRSLESLYVSPQIEDIAGVSPQEWMADPDLWSRMVDPEDRDRVLADYRASIEQGRPWIAEYRLRTADGRTIWVHDETTPLHDEAGAPTLLQGVIFDITERKLAEQALRESEQREREAAERLRALDDMKNTFLAAVSHELRSPLTSILGLSLTLERAPDMPDEDRGDLLRRLATNARKLDRLLKDLLDIDRLNRGIVEPQYRVTDVAALARRTVESLDALAGRDVAARTEPVVIPVDPAKVERIVENLLINAARHTPAERKIWLEVVPHDGGVLISVDDEGPGVPEELRTAIFEPFRQGPSPSPHSPGTGIGLSLVARFAELHEGRAWVEDREGGGASFRVFLPAHEPGGAGIGNGNGIGDGNGEVHDPVARPTSAASG